MSFRFVQVPSNLAQSPQFQAQKAHLEEIYLVKITIPSSDSKDVHIDGLNGDVDLVSREVDTFTSLNRPGSKQFYIRGKLEGQACKNWFSPKLDEAKRIIM